MDAFDADVLIHAADIGNAQGRRVAALLDPPNFDGRPLGVGSVVLLPEVLSRPRRDGGIAETTALIRLLARIELRPVDLTTVEMATELGATYRLRAADAIHLATAVLVGADRFITNNRKDFPKSIVEILVTYPDDLPG
jgi:predicted nucleic acid-binding protein